jgi:hypothetical protein
MRCLRRQARAGRRGTTRHKILRRFFFVVDLSSFASLSGTILPATQHEMNPNANVVQKQRCTKTDTQPCDEDYSLTVNHILPSHPHPHTVHHGQEDRTTAIQGRQKAEK